MPDEIYWNDKKCYSWSEPDMSQHDHLQLCCYDERKNREGASNMMSDEWPSVTSYTLAYCELLTIKPDMDLTCC